MRNIAIRIVTQDVGLMGTEVLCKMHCSWRFCRPNDEYNIIIMGRWSGTDLPRI